MTVNAMRFGGTITAGCDPVVNVARPQYHNALYFSHGRSAFIWLIQNCGPFESVAMCAYTWPEIPTLMRRYKLRVGLFDFGDKNIRSLVNELPGRTLVLVPVFYGFDPWIDYLSLSDGLADSGLVVLDAAQTAFGYVDYPCPKKGAVLACPHKATALNDGAVLAIGDLTAAQLNSYNKLDVGQNFFVTKKTARKLLASERSDDEKRGLRLVEGLEEAWCSDPPQRMTRISRAELNMLDIEAHKAIRQDNYRTLRKHLARYLTPFAPSDMGVPFAFGALVPKRAELIQKLHSRRVYATSLWPSAEHDQYAHPQAAILSREFMALPIDQRYNSMDMDKLAEIVISCLDN